jgi:hypothetical protein
MFKKRLKQYHILRQKKRLENKSPLFMKSGQGIFSPKRVSNFFFKTSNLNLISSGPSIVSNDLKNFEKSYLAFISKSVFWGA